MDYPTLWFAFLGILLTGYAILDGFDLGVGLVHPLARTDHEKRLFMNAIGPLWDGNEVWLVTFGGALFAAFPEAYATAFSAFYTPFMVLLFALIFRAVSMEFRSKKPWPWWRRFWDFSFFAASFLATFLFGLAVGNSMLGIPIGADHEFTGQTIDFWRTFPILVGTLTVFTFALHGAIYLYLKTDQDLGRRLEKWIWILFGIFVALYLSTTVYAWNHVPSALVNFEHMPVAWAVVALTFLAIANIPRAIYHRRPLYAFFSSSCTIAALIFLFGVALFPNLIVSNLNPEWNLTITNAASSEKTLRIMTRVALLGMPFVLTYTGIVYWVFKGKVELNKLSY